MSGVFGATMPTPTTLCISDKDYDAECDLIEADLPPLCRRHQSRSVLDLGCGTGNARISAGSPRLRGRRRRAVAEHAGPGARKARRRSAKRAESAFSRAISGTSTSGRPFDAALMMFAVLGYQLENADVLSALRTARRHLHPGGLLIVDVWSGPAVLHRPAIGARQGHPRRDGTDLACGFR